MKIGFDVSDLATGRADGTTRYTRELALRLPLLAPEHEWLLFSPGDFDIDLPSNARKVIAPWPKYWTQMRLPYDLYREKPDVLFMPIQQLPYVRPGKMRTVAVIHDLAFHEYGEQFTYKDWALLHVFSAYAAREADTVICVSQATANDVRKYYGRTENVRVVHHGVDHGRFKPDAAVAPSFKQPYLLFVGQIQPRKNIIRLIEAFEMMAEEDKGLRLVIAGGHGWLREPIEKRARESSFAERIIMPGAVPDEELPALYANAEVFVLPSLYEGFGMPVLEAMACGCPVVTANVSSLPEVAGGAAELVDPERPESIASGIKKARARRTQLIEDGIARASQFDWNITAKRTLEVILGV